MPKTILLTGATDGIGFLTAKKFATEGHFLLLHGRNQGKLKQVAKELNTLSESKVETFCADLSDLNDTNDFINKLLAQYKNIDVLVNNAGVYMTKTSHNKDHLDVRFVVNTIAPYLITRRLLPIMNKSGRVINLSSAAQAPVDFDLLSGKFHTDDAFSAYAQSKLGIMMWTCQLARNSSDDSPAIISVNPGSLLGSKMVKEGFGVEGKDLNIGADILLRLSLDDKFANASGLYFDNDQGELIQPHPDALDSKKCNDLIKVMEGVLKKVPRASES